jgi:FkbM family methyltransferase
LLMNSQEFYIYDKSFHDYHQLSFSQEGEDLVLAKLLLHKRNGFYVDVGAHHPLRFSNTYFFYRLGWRGINIDPLPGSMEIFNIMRPNDINLEIGISKSSKALTYYQFSEPALNSFCEKTSQERLKSGNKLIEKEEVLTVPLSEILDQYLPQNQKIDFLNIDAEGLDLEVLQSNNWSKYKPQFILVESLETSSSIVQANDSELGIFLRERGYQIQAKTHNTLFFTHNPT